MKISIEDVQCRHRAIVPALKKHFLHSEDFGKRMLALKAFFGHCPHFFVVLVAFFLILVAFFDFVVMFLLISYQSIFLHSNRHDRVTEYLCMSSPY